VLPKAVVDPKSPYVEALERLLAEYRAGLKRAVLKEGGDERKPARGDDGRLR